MNKLKTLALVSVCLFCAVTLIGTFKPFYVKAQEFEDGTAEKTQITREESSIEKTKEENDMSADGVALNTENQSRVDPLLDAADSQTQEKVEFKTETRLEDIAYGTTEIGVDTIPKGTKEVVSEGVPGKIKRIYLVKYVDGVKADEALYTEFPVSEPVNEVANVGIGGVVYANDGTAYNYNYRMQMEATAYTYMPPYTSMTTATGETLRKGIVAVDPKVIPMHTKLFITGSVEYGLGQAEDTGGAIKGNIVDLAYMSYDECIQFGRRQMQVYILD